MKLKFKSLLFGTIFAIGSVTSANAMTLVDSCFDEAWDYGTANEDNFYGGAYEAMDAYYTSNCMG